MNWKKDTKKLVETGVLIAIAFVLSFLKINLLPNGGSVTLVSMLPIVLLGYKYGPFWGLFSGVIFGVLQMIQEFYPPPAATLMSIALVMLLDYLIAWGMVGLIAGIFGKTIQNPSKSVALGAFFGITGRYFSSIISGIVIWGVYASEDQPVWLYSVLFNGTWAFPEMILTAVVGYFLLKSSKIQKLLFRSNSKN